jgi:TPR repeat protein
MKHLLRDAEKGAANSQFNVIDDNGHDCKRGHREAIKWLSMAAGQGLPRAQVRLAEIYAADFGKAGNSVKAYAWFVVALKNLFGAYSKRTQTGLERVSSHMT